MTDQVIIAQTEFIELPPADVELIEGSVLVEFVEVPTSEIIISTESTPEIVDATGEAFIFETAQQGPPGPPGPEGGDGESGPSMTYAAGALIRVDYDSGNYKLFTYDSQGVLSWIDYFAGAITTRNTFSYNPDGSLASVTKTTL